MIKVKFGGLLQALLQVPTLTGGNVDTQCTRDYTSDFKTTRTFKSKDELTTWARDVGSSCGWALSTLRGAMDDKGVAMPDVIILTFILEEVALKPFTKAIEDVFSPAKLVFSDRYNCYVYLRVREYCERIYGDAGQLFFVHEWDLLVQSPTEAEYDEQLKRLRTEFSMHPQALAYVANTWLKQYKEKLVAAWTNNIMHFGHTERHAWYQAFVPCIPIFNSEFEIDKFWKDMDASREKEHKCIKASFVESLSNEDEEYEDEEYRELRGVVSMSALEMIHGQTMPIEEEDTYHSVCNCAIKRTHGLPCAHEIAKYRTEGRPIPLDCIHPHWKKLDLEPLTRTAESGVDKMMKMNNSTPSAPLLSQPLESRQRNSPNAGLSIVHSNQERQPEAVDKVYHNQSTKPLEFIDVCPLVLRPYILDVKDVARDGHCGFRAIASLCNNDEDGWVKVRKNLINELKSNEAHYVQLFGSVQRVNQLHHALNYFGSSCLREHWMTMPDMGHIIASCYNVILIHLSSAQCFTFFPLRTVPISASSPIEIAIGLVNDHFVQVFLKPGHPMPPIPPDLTQKRKNIPPVATDWETTLEQRCTEWASPYIARIDHFKSLQPEVVLQKNPIVIDNDSLPSLENMNDFF
ncbi:hypothetical protein M0R45_024922 [Rubus argutus]|uniref:Uncharacterized protein n=1 Tax=Rubus argutus TaxID=59490 RepID=A0AAW1WSG7_RUBAR